MKRIFSILAAVGIIMGLSAFSGWAQDYPKEPITFIVPWGPGGASDLAARAIAKVIPKYLGQQMVILNKPGAGGAVGMEAMVRSKPDGYTMFMATIGSNTLTPAFTSKIPFKYDEITFSGSSDISFTN